VPNRNSADSLPLCVGHKIRHWHPALGEVNAKTQALQPPKADRPCRPPLKVEEKLGAILHKILVSLPGMRVARENRGPEQHRGLSTALVVHYAEVTCRVTRETPAEQGFHGFRGWVFWLLQGQWDRCVQEFEGSALGGSGYGEQVEAGLVMAGDA